MFSTTPVILVLGLVVATCVIAYWADNLGKKLGKKRISLFGLRPRQTATLISMATSVGIMLFTLAVLLVSSASLRNAIFRYDEIRREANENRRLLQTLRVSVVDAEKRAESARQTLEKTQSQLQRETVSTRKARSLTAAARKELQSAQNNLNAARLAESAAQRGQATARRGESNARRGETNALQAEAGARRGERRALLSQREAQGRAQRLRTDLSNSRSVLKFTRDELNNNGVQLAQQRAALNRVRLAAGGFIKRNGELIKRQAVLSASIETLKAQRETLEAQNQQAYQAFIKAAQDLAENAGGLVELLGQGKIAVGLGQVFAEARVSPASDAARARAMLRTLLDQGSETAKRLGGQPYSLEEGGVSRVLHLVPRSVGEPGQRQWLAEDAQIEQLATYLTTFTVPVSLRLVAARNYAEGEMRFEARPVIVPIKRAFVSGETITSATIDGTATDAQLFNLLLALVNAGEGVARGRGVVPLVSEKNPSFYAEGTNERIFDALREVQMRARTVRVRLIAAEDASTIDNLRVRFDIEGLAS